MACAARGQHTLFLPLSLSLGGGVPYLSFRRSFSRELLYGISRGWPDIRAPLTRETHKIHKIFRERTGVNIENATSCSSSSLHAGEGRRDYMNTSDKAKRLRDPAIEWKISSDAKCGISLCRLRSAELFIRAFFRLRWARNSFLFFFVACVR